jgi:hypothetical protein
MIEKGGKNLRLRANAAGSLPLTWDALPLTMGDAFEEVFHGPER